MSGPRIVCAGCGYPTTLYKPVCDDCMDFASLGRLDMGTPSKPEKSLQDAKTRGTSEGHADAGAASIPE